MISRYFEYFNPKCDGCGRMLGAEKSAAAAETVMRAAGWQKAEEQDLCPLCRMRYQETGRIPRNHITKGEQ